MANPTVGPRGGVSPQSIYDEFGVSHGDQDQGSNGYHAVGTRGCFSDGRVFYYASNQNVALTAGSLCIIPATTGLNIAASDNDIILTASSANFAAGARTGIALHEADIETADIIRNAYQHGYLYWEVSTGLGHTYKIARHDAFAFDGSSTSGTIDLFDPIKVAAAATTGISFAKNPYSRVITSSTSQNETAVGATPIAVTASGAAPTDSAAAVNTITTYNFWLQTWGPCAVEVGSTSVAPGVGLVSDGTADRLDIAATTGHTSNATALGGIESPIVGWGLVSAGGAAGETILVDLRIRP